MGPRVRGGGRGRRAARRLIASVDRKQSPGSKTCSVGARLGSGSRLPLKEMQQCVHAITVEQPTMRALGPSGGGRELVRFGDVDEPVARHDEAIVQVTAVSVNRGEAVVLERPRADRRPGKDTAGTLIEPATNGTGPQLDYRVIGVYRFSRLRRAVTVPVKKLAPFPARMRRPLVRGARRRTGYPGHDRLHPEIGLLSGWDQAPVAIATLVGPRARERRAHADGELSEHAPSSP